MRQAVSDQQPVGELAGVVIAHYDEDGNRLHVCLSKAPGSAPVDTADLEVEARDRRERQLRVRRTFPEDRWLVETVSGGATAVDTYDVDLAEGQEVGLVAVTFRGERQIFVLGEALPTEDRILE